MTRRGKSDRQFLRDHLLDEAQQEHDRVNVAAEAEYNRITAAGLELFDIHSAEYSGIRTYAMVEFRKAKRLASINLSIALRKARARAAQDVPRT